MYSDTQIDTAGLIAAFLAKGGNIQAVPEGTRAIASDRTIYAAMREGKLAAADSLVQGRADEAQIDRQCDAYRAAKIAGWTDENALDYAEHAK